MSNSNACRVFVYGTLRRGECNHHLLANAGFLGAYRTPPCFGFWQLQWCPAATTAGETAILGEVYAVDAATFADLDRLERYPEWYDRLRLNTPWGEAWCYVLTSLPATATPLPHGDWCLRA